MNNANAASNDATGNAKRPAGWLDLKRVAALVFIAGSAFFLHQATSYPYMDALGPGGGFFPVWIGGIALLVGLGLLVTGGAAAKPATPQIAEPRIAGSAFAVVVTVAALVGAAFLLEPLGFRATAFLLLLVLLRSYGAGWIGALVVSAVGSLAVFAVFTALNVRLPAGPYGF